MASKRRLSSLPPNLLAVLMLCQAFSKDGLGHWPYEKVRPVGFEHDDMRRFFSELVTLGFIEVVHVYGRDDAPPPVYRLPPAPRRPGFVWRLKEIS